jgi:hypothetical protein
VVGNPGAGARAPGPLSVFRPPAPPATQGGASQGLGAQRGAPAGLVAAAELFLAVHAADMVSHGFALRLRPGAPRAVELLPGHPFTGPGEGGGGGGEAGVAAVGESDVVQSTPLEGAGEAAAAGGGGAKPSPAARSGGGGGKDRPLLAIVTSGDDLPEFQVGALRGQFCS